MTPFQPLLRNAHLTTIAAAYWPRRWDERRYPVEAKLVSTEPGVRILVHVQKPAGEPRGEVVLLHGLEGSSEAPYIRGMAQAMLDAGFVTHRVNMRTCGGTEFQCKTGYHAGLTIDLFTYLMELDRLHRTPVFAVGFSLGGNVVLKLAGEMGEDGRRVLAGVGAVSTPLDLKLCTRKIGQRSNYVYERMFLTSMRKRLHLRKELLGDKIPWAELKEIRSLYEWDDLVTAPSFGFHGADHYYETQSANQFLHRIRVPALIVHAKDDPMVDFRAYAHPALSSNSRIQTIISEHGGHIGFLSRSHPRIWVDALVRDWIAEQGNN